jgi:hypothetical protein
MIKAPPRTPQQTGFAVSGKRLVHGGAGAKIQEIRRCPNMIFRPGLDSGKDGGIDRVSMFPYGVIYFCQKNA